MTHYFGILATNETNAPTIPETNDNLLANRIFLHYSVQHYFFKDSFWEQKLSELDANNISGVIIHGEQDSDCLVEQARYLHKNGKTPLLLSNPLQHIVIISRKFANKLKTCLIC